MFHKELLIIDREGFCFGIIQGYEGNVTPVDGVKIVIGYFWIAIDHFKSMLFFIGFKN
jgi:hypothetical protein